MINCNEENFDLKVSAMRQLFVLHRKIVDLILNEIHNDCLSRTEVMIIFLLKKREYRVTDLAKEMGIPSSTLTGIIDRLIEKGYVKRYRSKEDRRVVIVGLEKKTQERVERINEKIQKVVEMTKHKLSDDWWLKMSTELNKLEEVLDEVGETLNVVNNDI